MNTPSKSTLIYLTFGLLTLSFLYSCTKEDDSTPPGNQAPSQYDLVISMDYHVDGEALVQDEMNYTNQAGNDFSVNTIHYYLSSFSLQKSNNEWVDFDNIAYFSAFESGKNQLVLKNVPVGDYQQMKMVIGLLPENNASGGLPAETDHINMAWPDMMGGGYHFLKLEGYFMDDSSKTKGYAMHIGKSSFHSNVALVNDFKVESADTLKLTMNVAEWFKNPNTYDFNINGNYSMGKDSSMRKLSENGVDVISFK